MIRFIAENDSCQPAKTVAAPGSMRQRAGSLIPSVSSGPDDRPNAATIYFMQDKGGAFVNLSDFQEPKQPATPRRANRPGAA